MIILNSKKVERALFGAIAGLFVTTLPVAVAAGDQSLQGQSEKKIYNSTKQPDNDNQKHIKINYDNSSDHNYSIAPQRKQIYPEMSPQNHKHKQLRDGSN